MTLIASFIVSSSGLEAQKIKMDLASSNLANVQTTRGPDGKPYRKVTPIFESVPIEFDGELQKEMGTPLQQVKLAGLEKDMTPLKRVYDPGHPDADDKGFVELPNVNLIQEMSDMLLASRAYEANVTAFNTTKTMALKSLDLGKI